MTIEKPTDLVLVLLPKELQPRRLLRRGGRFASYFAMLIEQSETNREITINDYVDHPDSVYRVSRLFYYTTVII